MQLGRSIGHRLDGGRRITWEVNEQWQLAKVVIGCWVQQANTLQKCSDLSADLDIQ